MVVETRKLSTVHPRVILEFSPDPGPVVHTVRRSVDYRGIPRGPDRKSSRNPQGFSGLSAAEGRWMNLPVQTVDGRVLTNVYTVHPQACGQPRGQPVDSSRIPQGFLEESTARKSRSPQVNGVDRLVDGEQRAGC